MTVELSGEITAIATAALAAFAVVTAVFAFLAYRKQSQEAASSWPKTNARQSNAA